MKKVITAAMLVAFGAIAYVNATAPTAPTIYGPTTWECVYGWNVATQSKPAQRINSNTSNKDSLVGTDTIVLLNKYPLDPGYEYIVQIRDTTGAADSIEFEGTTYMFDGATYLRKSMYDTVGGATTYKVFTMPVGSTAFGGSVTLKAIKWIGTLKAKIWRFELIRRKFNSK